MRRCGISASSDRIGDVAPPPNVAEWFHDYLDLSAYEQKKLYSRWPSGAKRIERLGKDRLREWLAFFESDAVGMDRDRLRKMIASRPQLLAYELSNVRSTTSFFREELGLSSAEYASLLRSYPSALMHSVDRRLRPTVAFLQDECGGGKDNWRSWRRVVYAYPRVFSHSLEGTLRPKVRFLRNGGAGLHLLRSELSQVVGTFPPTLWLGEATLSSKLEFLRESLGLDPPELRAVVVSYPQVLGLSLENNLRVKVEFFLGGGGGAGADGAIGCGLSREQLKEFVLYQPALLAYSLEKRLRPRIARMQEMNISL